MSIVKLTGISKTFKSNKGINFDALFNINLEINEGEVVCILGPSGSGKTTLLRIIAGIDIENDGAIELNGTLVNNINAQHRNIGFVFQNVDAIYPHLNVFENVAFPLKLKLRNSGTAYINNEVRNILHKVNLSNKEKSYPHELSGGEKQRVAIARALIYKPKLLLLDEPLSSLDNILKREILDLIKILHDQFKTTILYVTHDEREAIEIADRIIIMNEGKILQEGTVKTILEKPLSSQIARIIGGWNILNGNYLIEADNHFFLINDQKFNWEDARIITNKSIEIGFPVSNLKLRKESDIDDSSLIHISCLVSKIIKYQGNLTIEVLIGNERVRIENPQVSGNLKQDENAVLYVEKNLVIVFP